MCTAGEELAEELYNCSVEQQDPVWRLPLWDGYKNDLNSPIADLNNVASHRYAGAIGAALFLQEFVLNPHSWLHFDLMGWNPASRPGRPEGGEALSMRALDALLANRYSPNK